MKPYKNASDVYLKYMDNDDYYASLAIAAAIDIVNQLSRWHFDEENKKVQNTAYMAYEEDGNDFNYIAFAFCNKNGKFNIGFFFYNDHSLVFDRDDSFTEEQIIQAFSTLKDCKALNKQLLTQKPSN